MVSYELWNNKKNMQFITIYISANKRILLHLIKQQINLKIFKAFADAKIDFAYPTQTILSR